MENNFCDFLFVAMSDEIHPKHRSIFLKRRIWTKFFFFFFFVESRLPLIREGKIEMTELLPLKVYTFAFAFVEH